jgi:hypothetical protein
VADDDLVAPLHAGARGAYATVGVLLALLIVTIPVAIAVFVVRRRARLELRDGALIAIGWRTRRWDLARLRRIGELRVPLNRTSSGHAVAAARVGGDHAIHLGAIDDVGRRSTLLLSSYEGHEALLARIVARTGLTLEPLESTGLGPRWP